MYRPFPDVLNPWVLLTVTVLLFALASEIGYRISRPRPIDQDSDEKSHAGVLLAAILALLGLLLAFSFSIVESRFQTRRHLVVQEANAIGTTYLRANMLPGPHAARVRDLLRQYVEFRLTVDSPDEGRDALEASEKYHTALWAHADTTAAMNPDSEVVGLFIRSLNEVIDLHEERVAVALYIRLPLIIIVTLYLVALLSMGLLGYNAGLARARPILPTLAVILAVSIVLMLIVELDRPSVQLFRISQQALSDAREAMTEQSATNPNGVAPQAGPANSADR